MSEENNNSNENISSNKAITIRALRRQTRDLISALLTPEKYIPSEKGLQRDWHGLAELCGITGERIPSLQQSRDPSNAVLDIWIDHNKDESTIDRLLSFFEDLDRFDIIYEIKPLIEKDIEYFKENSNGVLDYPVNDESELIITVDDVLRINQGLPPQQYDAFVLFADEDIDFATELINKMEKDFSLKLCVKHRDLLIGAIEHDSIIQLITRRCKHLIVIVSPSFFESPVRKYYYGFAQVEGIEHKSRKIIPCLIKPCDNLPRDFRLQVALDYTKDGKFYNFHEKLFNSIRSPDSTNNLVSNSMETLTPNTVSVSIENINAEETPSETITPLPRTPSREENLSSTSESDIGTVKKKNSIYKRLKEVFRKQSEDTNNECDDRRCVEKVKKKSKKKTLKNSKKEVAITI